MSRLKDMIALICLTLFAAKSFAYSIFEPSIECTLTRVHSTRKVFCFESLLRQFWLPCLNGQLRIERTLYGIVSAVLGNKKDFVRNYVLSGSATGIGERKAITNNIEKMAVVK